jgi:HD-like signal output (HDOD) protein
LVLLGFNTIKNIAISSELVKLSSSCPENRFFKYRELWEHMLAVGATGKVMAKVSGEDRKHLEEYFIAGLIHDLGDFLMMRFVPEEFHRIREFAQNKSMPVSECAQQVLGFSSGEMGVELARQWKLQDHLQRVISNVDQNTEVFEKLDRVVWLADKYCRSSELGYVSDTLGTDIEDSELLSVGLPVTFFEDYGEDLVREVEKAKVFIA